MKELVTRLLPELLVALPGFRLYSMCVVVLALKMFVLALLTGRARARLKTVAIPEDAAMGDAQWLPAEHPAVERIMRAHRNDAENIPAFFAIGLVAVLAGAPPLGLSICCIVFTAARLAHTILFLKAIQPWRSISFGVGTLAALALLVMITLRVFS